MARPTWLIRNVFAGLMVFSLGAAAAPKFDFPVYKNNPPGRQVGGNRAAETAPALSPEASQAQFTVPPGFEVRLFAAEPWVVNPVAMTWDERGRLWVLELYEYPSGAPEGEPGRDRIKILEDTDADGVADKVHVWADGLSLATGLVLGDGGAYVGQAPHLLHLKDTDGDDRADTREIVLTGFGMEDRHELLNGFTWGPDGYLYMTHGVFTHSKVKDPDDPDDDGVIMNAAVARFDPRTKRFEVFADGTSNPWGVDFDAVGNAFVSACVIDHLFHLIPGGIYERQAGQPGFPYAYELLPSIVDHRHHMAAYAGVQVYLGDQYPDEFVGKVMMGNIHDNSVHADHLTPKGASFVASEWKDFLRSDGDGWFRPVSQLVGPDGALWVADWYDKYPCYQNAMADPGGVDREYGRIWRVVYTGNDAGRRVASRPDVDMDLKALSSEGLVSLLSHKNAWHRRTAQRLLSERGESAFGRLQFHPETPLHELLDEENGASVEARLAALWTLHTSGLMRDSDLIGLAEDDTPAIRAWAARLAGERGRALGETMQMLAELASDPDPTVRLAVSVAARQFVSGSLTVNTPPRYPLNEVVTGGILSELLKSSAEENDPVIAFSYWMALEPLMALDPVHAIGFYEGALTKRLLPLSATVLGKIMRRVSDMGDTDVLKTMLTGMNKLGDNAEGVLQGGLKGLIEGQRGRMGEMDPEIVALAAKLTRHSDSEVAALAGQLGTIWGDAAALVVMLQVLADETASEEQRLAAIRVAGQSENAEARSALFRVVQSKASSTLKVAAVQGLTNNGDYGMGYELLKGWSDYSPSVRQAVAILCTTRGHWKWQLFAAVDNGLVGRGEVPPSVIRALATSRSSSERERATELFGRVTKTSEEKQRLIRSKRAVVLGGKPDLEKGRAVAATACLVCHKLHGQGAEIGPDLTGVGRSSLDALLNHVIDPNQIIGQGYENVVIETRDGQSFSGRVVEDSDARVRLVNLGPTEYVIAKDRIKERKVSEFSLMPEGLEALPDEDFRNLIWFILTPPEEGPVSEERRQELIGEENESAAIDGESVALWNPRWRVLAPEFEGTPRKHPVFAGRTNVLETHPYDQEKPAAIEASLLVPETGGELHWAVAAHPEGDWELRAFVQGELVKRETVKPAANKWTPMSLDLDRFAGKQIQVRLENAANGWAWEFGYWHQLKLQARENAGE